MNSQKNMQLCVQSDDITTADIAQVPVVPAEHRHCGPSESAKIVNFLRCGHPAVQAVINEDYCDDFGNDLEACLRLLKLEGEKFQIIQSISNESRLNALTITLQGSS